MTPVVHLIQTLVRVAGDVLWFAFLTSRSHATLAAENLFLRKQVALYVERGVKPRRAHDGSRMTLVALSYLTDCRGVLTIVKPETLIRWHRQAFCLSGAERRGLRVGPECPETCST